MSQPPYPEEVRRRAVARALDSRTSVAEVARDVGCPADTLRRWLRVHRQREDRPTESHVKATFVPVNIIDAGNHPVEIVMPSGVAIKLADASPRYIAELLNVLATC